jgi:hypothetical protein
MNKTIFLSAAGALALMLPAGALAHDRDDDRRSDSRAQKQHVKSDRTIGAVESFSDGVLVLKLTNGDTVTGQVDEDTRIKCKRAFSAKAASSKRDEGGDDVRKSEDDDHNASSDHRRGEHRGDHDGHDHGRFSADHRRCGPDALVAGALVRKAKVDATADGLVFEEVKLARKQAR